MEGRTREVEWEVEAHLEALHVGHTLLSQADHVDPLASVLTHRQARTIVEEIKYLTNTCNPADWARAWVVRRLRGHQRDSRMS